MIGYFALLDILILPYFPRLIMPYSLPVVTVALLFGTRFRRDLELTLFTLLATCVVASAALSVMYRIDGAVMENAKRALQLLSAFVYFFYFRWLVRESPLRVTPVLVVFVAYFFGLLILWTSHPMETADWLAVAYPEGDKGTESLLLFFRFPYIFSDANTAAYFYLIAAGFLARIVPRLSTTGLVALLFGAVVVVISTQSRGAMVALALVVVVGLWLRRRAILRHPVWVAITVGVLIAGILVAWSWLSARTGDGTQVGTLLTLVKARFSGEQGDWQQGRSTKYWWAITANVPFLIGRGYVLMRDGAIFSPHSDHLRLILSYGIIAWAATLYLLFRKFLRVFAFAIPALVAFSINSLIDEQKVFALYLIAVAVWASTSVRRDMRDTSSTLESRELS